MTTSPIVSFGSNELTIRDDATITLLNGGLQPLGNLDDLEMGTANNKPFATYESNFWLLDGEYKFPPADPADAHAGWMSTIVSGSTGGFDFTSPHAEIQIDFDVVHSTSGLYLTFSEHTGDYADTVRVVFYDASLVTIIDVTYNPTGTTFFTNQSVANFKRILIDIQSTNRASRYARLTSIDFDTLTRFTGADIKAARVVEEINLLSVELPINTLELTLFSNVGAFSIVNPTGVYASLQYKEPLDVHEDMNGAMIYIGRFYLDRWESVSANEAKFEASDAIGLMTADYLPQIFPGTGASGNGIGGLDPIDRATFDTPAWYLIQDIMLQAGVEYELDPSLEDEIIEGWVPIVSCREYLQQVLFRIGAYASCARSSVIQIRPIELASDLLAFDFNITSAEKGINSPLQLKPVVTGVEVTSHDYVSDGLDLAETINITGPPNGNIFIVKFAEPIRDVSSITNAATERYGSAWYELESSGGTITFTSRGWIDTQKLDVIYDDPPAGTPANIVKITDATLVGVNIVEEVTQRVYDYHQQRYLQKTKLFASFISPGDSVLVNVQSSRQLKGIVEKMSTDLAGGYISDVEITGVIVPL